MPGLRRTLALTHTFPSTVEAISVSDGDIAYERRTTQTLSFSQTKPSPADVVLHAHRPNLKRIREQPTLRPEAVLVSRDRRAPDGPRPVASRALEGRGGARRTEPPNAAVKVGRHPSSGLVSAALM